MLEGIRPPENKAVYCKVSKLKDEISPEDYQILMEAIANHQLWPAKTLAKTLRERGLLLADTTISKHRNNQCACYRG